MNWSGKRVLVTGAGGFIGSHLVERLVAEGAEVRAFVHYNALGQWGWLDSSPIRNEIEVIPGDITDRDSVLSAMDGTSITFHLAALIGIPYSYVAPASYVRTNIEGTLNVLQAARVVEIERLVHTSTSEVYGTAQQVPITENHPLQGQSPYSATKIGADKIVESFHRSYGVPVVTVRPFNTYGPRQSARAVIPTIIGQALKGRSVKLGHLHPTRDLTYVEDMASGFIRAAEADAAIGCTINLGSGKEISIGNLVDRIAKLTGREITVEQEEMRKRPSASEVERLLADTTQARARLGWAPEVGLDEGLSRTISWIEQRLDSYRAEEYVR